jgi:ankyrin repeat protein
MEDNMNQSNNSNEENDVNQFLIMSARKEDIDCVLVALEQGANINAMNSDALRIAVSGGNIEMVQLLLNHGANPNTHDILNWPARNGHFEIVQLLLKYGPHQDDIDSAFRMSAEEGHFDIVHLLLQNGADVHFDDDHALISAAARGHIDIVVMLLKRGANVSADNNAALRWSIHNGHKHVVRLLLKYGANVKAVDEYIINHAPFDVLSLAVKYGKYNEFNEFNQFNQFEQKINPNDGNINKLLMSSAADGDIDGVYLALEKGADIHYNNDYALRISSEKGYNEIVKLIQEHIEKIEKST